MWVVPGTCGRCLSGVGVGFTRRCLAGLLGSCLPEALLRADAGNWCIVNDGAAAPSVVLGISGKPHALVDVAAAHR